MAELSDVAQQRIRHIGELRRAGFSYQAIAGYVGAPPEAVAKLVGVQLYRHGDPVCMSYSDAIEAIETAAMPVHERRAASRDWLFSDKDRKALPSNYWERLLQAAQKSSGYSRQQILGDGRSGDLPLVRRALYVIALEDGHPSTKTGRKLNRDHSTIINRRKEQTLRPHPRVVDLIQTIRAHMEAA